MHVEICNHFQQQSLEKNLQWFGRLLVVFHPFISFLLLMFMFMPKARGRLKIAASLIYHIDGSYIRLNIITHRVYNSKPLKVLLIF